MRTLGVELDRAEALYDAYFEALPCVKETFNSAQRLAERRGYIKTLLGRRSRFNEYEENPFRAGMMQRAGTRKALNRCLQGGAADILKKAMLTCWREGLFNGDNCRTSQCTMNLGGVILGTRRTIEKCSRSWSTASSLKYRCSSTCRRATTGGRANDRNRIETAANARCRIR